MRLLRRLIVMAILAAAVYRGLRYLGVIRSADYDDPFTIPTDET